MSPIACYESELPLSPSGQVKVDPALIGTWKCTPDPPKSTDVAELRVVAFDEHQYYLEWQEGADTDRYRAYASRVDGSTLLNVRELFATASDVKWVFLRSRLDPPARLRLSLVQKSALAGLDAKNALKTIVRRVRDENLYEPWAVCSRVGA